MKKPGIFVFVLYAILIALMVLAVIWILPRSRRLSDDVAERDRQAAIRDQLQKTTSELSAEVNALQNDPAAIEKVAREKFNMSRPDETVVEYRVQDK